MLTPAKQEWVFDVLLHNSYDDAVKKVKEELGFKTNHSSLGRFFTWYALSKRREEHIKLFRDDIIAQGINLDEDNISRASHALFELIALEERDPKLYLALRKLKQGDEKISAEERKISILEEKHAALKRTLEAALQKKNAEGGLTEEARKQIEEAAAIL
jgi:hypothetical protein